MSLEIFLINNGKTLKIPSYFNSLLTNIPFGVNTIIFDEDIPNNKLSLFNKSIDILPNSLTHLTMGSYFNLQIDNLPQKLTYLKLEKSFNKKVDNLPNSIKYLKFDFP